MASSAADNAAGEEHTAAGHKRKRNYFDDDDVTDNDAVSEMAKADDTADDGATRRPAVSSSDKPPVQWEYRGNQDQQIHGPYTTDQMMGWIHAGYFVGEAAVDVRRRVPPGVDGGHGATAAAAGDATADLMADLMESDDDEESNDNAWERSDKVAFKSFLV